MTLSEAGSRTEDAGLRGSEISLCVRRALSTHTMHDSARGEAAIRVAGAYSVTIADKSAAANQVLNRIYAKYGTSD